MIAAFGLAFLAAISTVLFAAGWGAHFAGLAVWNFCLVLIALNEKGRER